MSLESKREEIEARRAARRAEAMQGRAEQELIDLQALDDAEDQHGCQRVAEFPLDRHVVGLPCSVIVRAPTALEFKRYQDQVKNLTEKDASGRIKFGTQLGETCLVYPSKEVFAQLKDEFPAMPLQIAERVVRLAIGARKEEGKE